MPSPPNLKIILNECSQRTCDGMTYSIEAQLAKARESIAAAQLLIKDGYFDFAASRAYYAML